MKIHGTWLEFQHCFECEGKYWNSAFRSFSEAQWRALIAEIAATGMEYLVLMASAIDSKTFYRSELFAKFEGMATENVMEVLFDEADRQGLKIFVSNDFFGDWSKPDAMFSDAATVELRRRATAEIAAAFAHHPSFYGWYWPNEAAIFPYFSENFVRYVNDNSAFVRSLAADKKTLIAPYGTFRAKPDDVFCRQLAELDVDFVAYQDEIGVRKANVDWTPYFFEGLRQAHDKVGRSSIWADVEVFRFEGKVYQSALISADVARVRAQIEAIEPFVDKVLIYQYPGLISAPGSKAYTPSAEAEMLHCGLFKN